MYLKTSQDADVCNKPWYASACDRRTADEALMRFNKVRIKKFPISLSAVGSDQHCFCVPEWGLHGEEELRS